MPDHDTTVAVRMYNVGFGDAFRIAVERGQHRWTMLVDCGVHGSGQSRDMKLSVQQIIADVRESPGTTGDFDVIVATHHHRDHISGFADDQWKKVSVGEVWLPFAADKDDPDTVALGGALPLAATAERLLELIGPEKSLAANPALSLARQLALNSSVNDKAMDRLLGRNRRGFATDPRRRFLPSTDAAENTLAIGLLDITAHVLGPSRDPEMLRKMNPPKRAGWLTLDRSANAAGRHDRKVDPPFASAYVMPGGTIGRSASPALRALELARRNMRLEDLADTEEGLLAAAALLERAVNNTSLFFVLEVGGLTLLFPGDAQYGAWEHVRSDPTAQKLIDNVDFYKVGHHGSYNATPGRFATTEWTKHGDAMIPWGNVKIWADTIPWQPLLEQISDHGRRRIVMPATIIESKPRPIRSTPELTVDANGRWWTELTYRVPRM